MFSLAIFIGIYSYLILLLGLFGELRTQWVAVVTIAGIFIVIVYFRKSLRSLFENIEQLQSVRRSSIPHVRKTIQQNSVITLSILLFALLAIINLIGALGPELAFDALWYHLTLPKLYLLTHSITHIPGGLLYYSDMPRLTEMLYTAALAIDTETAAKLIHFTFGILTSVVVYKLGRKFFDKKIALLAMLIFYGNLVVDWESITAYIDLSRAFFESLALLGFLEYSTTMKRQWLVTSAVMTGLAICTKTLAIGSIAIFMILIIFLGRRNKKNIKMIFIDGFYYGIVALLVPFPWFFLSYLNTGNPFYPIFSGYEIHQTAGMLLDPFRFLQTVWQLFTHSPDPLSPIYILSAPLLLVPFLLPFAGMKKLHRSRFFPLALYCLVAILVWYVTPQTGGGRFIIPYLPAFSVVAATVFAFAYPKTFKNVLIGIILLITCISIVYRGAANRKYLPVILGQESRDHFLSTHLNYNFGDFYDTGEFYKRHLRPGEKILLYGFHNLYYVDYPFIDSSWVQPGDRFTYIAVQNGNLPKRFQFWSLDFIDNRNHVKLYTMERREWIY